MLEYTSARARMSVIVRAPDDGIHLFCKGADAKARFWHRHPTLVHSARSYRA